MRSTVVVALSGALVRETNGKLPIAFVFRSEAHLREVVAEQGHQVVSDLPCDSSGQLPCQVIWQPCTCRCYVSI